MSRKTIKRFIDPRLLTELHYTPHVVKTIMKCQRALHISLTKWNFHIVTGKLNFSTFRGETKFDKCDREVSPTLCDSL